MNKSPAPVVPPTAASETVPILRVVPNELVALRVPITENGSSPGTPGGGNATTNDVIAAITLTAGLTSPNNNFGERLLPGSLTGYVYRDPDVNGLRSPQGGSGTSRPRVCEDRTASGERRLASSESRRARKVSATGPVVRMRLGDST